MKLQIIGENGNFGSFLKELLTPHFDICDNTESVILAVPLSAYDELGAKFKDKYIINICSVQKPSMDILLKYTDKVTGIHPLFGRRTPEFYRNSILTYSCTKNNDTWFNFELENEFLNKFCNVSDVLKQDAEAKDFTPESHDILMAKTHLQAITAAQQCKILTDRAKDIPDVFLPHSFRKLKEFVQSINDCPQGTLESILANPYA